MAKKNAANVVGVKTKTTWKQAFKRDWQLYLLLLLPLIMVFGFLFVSVNSITAAQDPVLR